MKSAFESKLNSLLSKLLNQMGVTSHSEYLGQGRKDVLIYHQGLAIALEGSYEKQDAEKDTNIKIASVSTEIFGVSGLSCAGLAEDIKSPEVEKVKIPCLFL